MRCINYITKKINQNISGYLVVRPSTIVTDMRWGQGEKQGTIFALPKTYIYYISFLDLNFSCVSLDVWAVVIISKDVRQIHKEGYHQIMTYIVWFPLSRSTDFEIKIKSVHGYQYPTIKVQQRHWIFLKLRSCRF